MQHRELARFIADTLAIDESDSLNYVDAKRTNYALIDGRFDLCALAQDILTHLTKEPT